MKYFLFCCLVGLAGKVLAQTPEFITKELDQYIETGIKEWQVPGLSLVIVKDGKVVHMKGYGVKDIATNEPVDENTLFMIASNSKLFTGTALANLEYNKKLSLNDKVTKFFPDYALYDSLATKMVTVKDMLCHRIGTKTFQGDFTFWNSKLSRREIMYRMRYLKPVGEFRQDYGYCNSCFLTAGEVIPRVTGQPWEVYVYDSILMPLDMKNTHMLSTGLSQRNNVAVPYSSSFTNVLTRVPYDQWDNLGPAASMISSVNDLSHWLLFQLDSGRYNNKRVLPWAVLQKTRDLNIVVNSRKSPVYPAHIRGYGLGVFSGDYNGRQVYWHGGGAAGMLSQVCFVPEENLGIAILTNNDNQSFYELLRYQILDAYLGVPFVNRSKQQLEHFNTDMQKQVNEVADWRKLVKAAGAPPVPLQSYTGTYTHQLYGSLTIVSTDANSLHVKFNSHNNLTANLSYMGNNEWLLAYENIEYGIFKTSFKMEGKQVRSLIVKANDFVEADPYEFIKAKE